MDDQIKSENTVNNSVNLTARYPDLAGKVALVTGSSRGIGFAAAKAFASNGAIVILNGRDPQRLQEALEIVRAINKEAISIQGDFTDSRVIQSASEQIQSRYGQLDALVANVGGGERMPTVEVSEEQWRKAIDTNLTSVFLAIQAFLPPMLAKGSGSIITISSSAGRQPSEASAGYSAAKAGVVMLTRHLAKEFGAQGVRFNCVAPGAVLTEEGMLSKAPKEIQEKVAALHPLGRLGTPEDIANAILFVASESASWLTGITIDVSGGRVTV